MMRTIVNSLIFYKSFESFLPFYFMLNKVTEALTSVSKVNKTDSTTLLSTFLVGTTANY